MSDQLLEKIKDRFLAFDPVEYCQKYLTLDNKPFRINGNGYKAFSDMYRYIGIKALEKDSLPVVILKSRQVGGTTLLGALELFFTTCGVYGTSNNPPIRIIHAFPFLDWAAAYTKVKLNGMISSSIVSDSTPIKKGGKIKSHIEALLDSSSPVNDSLQFKQFVGGNHIFIESVGLDGGRLRGKTSDILFLDEVQDMSAAAISNSTKVLTKAQYGPVGQGVQVYLGTPKQRSSSFYDMWNQSSQQYYYLGCAKCKKHFPLYTPGSDDWEKIWLYGFTVQCTHCGFAQDKKEATENGKWIGTKDINECKFVGFHINQLYMPDFTKETILAQKPGVSATNTERAYQNEVLGEFFAGEAGVITPEQIRDLCGDHERKFRAQISPGEDVFAFLGIDIGAKNDLEQLVDSNKVKSQQGQSYSTAVVLTATGPNRLSIEFGMKFKRNDLASKKGIIDELMRKYSIKLAVNDLGYAGDLSEILQTEYGNRILSSAASFKVNNKVKYNAEIFPKVITFERDFWIADLYEQMKKGNIRFPLGSYEQIAWLIQHCCSMEIKPSISRNGDITPHYIKGNTPNDGFAALLNAYIAYKYYISDGFKIKGSLSGKEIGKDDGPGVLLGYVPSLFGGRK